MVFYRKYRPQLISELDLTSVREKLTSILSAKEIPHAFLFAGPKGLGKTSSARILAKAINCEKRGGRGKGVGDSKAVKKESLSPSLNTLNPDIEPCNTCSACISITNGSAVDVLEIDAASNRGIDEIRDLRERIKFSPAALTKKAYIIDEVHMLTTEAFNALLKTLEEPPSHVVFILATTELHKLPETIISRAFYVQFEKPSSKELARCFERIVKAENLDVENGVLEKVGELSDGAFRDGAKILEELSLQSKGKKITLELLELLYKTGSTDSSVEKLLDQTLKKDYRQGLATIQELSNIQADFKLVIEKLADNLHKKLLESVSKQNKEEISDFQKLLELLDEAYKNLKGAVLPQLPLELAVIEFCLVEDKKQEIVSVEKKADETVIKREEKKEEAVGEAKEVVKKVDISSEEGFQTLKHLIDEVNKENKILAGLLRGCRIHEENGQVSIIAPSTFHLGKLTESKNKVIIEGILGKSVEFSVK